MTTYYVDPVTGNNSDSGLTEALAFLTVQKGIDVAVAGDTIYLRGGTYDIGTSQITISASGSSGSLISLFNYPSEIPIIDGSNLLAGGNSCIRILTGVNWWHIKGLELINAAAHGIRVNGTASNNIIENNHCHHNVRLDGSGAGIQVEFGSNNLILNNDCHHNGLAGTSGGDGIGVGSTLTGNIVRGNRSWRNNDDGFDFWDAANILIENNLSWENGLDDSLVTTTGNGIGFKLGGTGGSLDGNHIVRNNFAWRNDENGIDNNQANIPCFIYNNTAWDNNVQNFVFHISVAHVMRNNLSYSGANNIHATVDDTFNSWNLGVTVTDADFQSLSYSTPPPARNSDGSLPNIPFLKLVSGSDLIDAGTDVGITYFGSAPDLGAYELPISARFIGFSANSQRFRYIRDNSDILYLADIATYTGQQLTSANGHIVSANVSSADFTIASADAGAVMTVGAKPTQTVHGSGLATHMYLVNLSANRLLMVTTCSSQVLASGNAVTIGSWSVTALASAST